MAFIVGQWALLLSWFIVVEPQIATLLEFPSEYFWILVFHWSKLYSTHNS